MIYEKAKLGPIHVKNRFIRSATHEGLADEHGYPTEKLLKRYKLLAKNEVGCIITGYAGVSQEGKSNYLNMLMINDDTFIEPYRIITEKVHEYGSAIIIQLAHCGRQTRSKVTKQPTVAPSAIKDKIFNEQVPKELTENEINRIIESFVSAIVRANKAGFDGCQLHLAHGYLLAQFLSSYTNRRRDKWGGSTENKFRIIAEIFKRARERVGNYPVFVKMNAYDGRKNGMRISEAIEIAKMLQGIGCAGIEISCGVYEDGLFSVRGKKIPIEAVLKYNFTYKNYPNLVKSILKKTAPLFIKSAQPIENYNVEAAASIKKNIDIQVIVVGGIKSKAAIEEIITKDKADFVAMSRPFIAEPNIIMKFKSGMQDRSGCINCNFCVVAQEERILKCYRGKIDKTS